MNIGRVVEIDQREDPRGYQREYQRIWRKEHAHYYRDKARAKAKLKKKNIELKEIHNMTTENDIKEIKEILKRMQESIDKLSNHYPSVTHYCTDKFPYTVTPTVPPTQACSEEELLHNT